MTRAAATAPRLLFGPQDHDRLVTEEECSGADYVEGYQYEIIDGRLYVSPLPNYPSGFIERWTFRKLDRYSDRHPEVTNFVYNKTRVFVPNRLGVTAPEPDVAAYCNFPVDSPPEEVVWREVNPFLVVEVISPDTVEKDTIRNVELYLGVAAIREYWLLDGRGNWEQPDLTVYRRRGQNWQKPIEVAGGGVFTTKLLPEFELTLNCRT